ncbi:hypothetical protein ABZ897_62325 [Nonomuraea sp. NPDC046802]|uniref:hypothetical protein n=1 Tax=Nonomuraea sp. NPDC046802 TaxID=3154919 RepID=UPI0033F7D4F1
MICQLKSKILAACFLTFASGSTVFAGCVAPLSADAATSDTQPKRKAKSLNFNSDADDGSSNPNNRSVTSKTIAVDSPTNNYGFQHTSTSTPGGTTSVQNALCKRTPVCKITQKVVVVAPGTADEAVRSAANTVTPPEADDPEPDDVEALTSASAEMPLVPRMIEDVVMCGQRHLI